MTNSVTRTRDELLEQRESFWYPEASRVAVLDELEAMYNDGLRHRTKSIAIITPANGGKSQIVIQFQKRRPEILRTNEESDTIPSVVLSMTNIKTLPEFCRQLLAAIRAPTELRIKGKAETYERGIERFIRHARDVNCRIIFLDEFHDCIKDGKGEQFLRATKGLLLEGFYVVPMGTEELEERLLKDPQIWSRLNFERGRLAAIKDVGVVKRFAELIAGIKDVLSDGGASYIIRCTDGIIGHILDFIEETYRDQNDLSLTALRKQVGKMAGLQNIYTKNTIGVPDAIKTKPQGAKRTKAKNKKK